MTVNVNRVSENIGCSSSSFASIDGVGMNHKKVVWEWWRKIMREKKLKIEMGDIWCWLKVWNLRQGHSPGWVFPGLFIQMVSGTLLSWSSLVRTQGSLFLPSPPCVLSIILAHHFTYCVLMPASSMSISFQTTDAPFQYSLSLTLLIWLKNVWVDLKNIWVDLWKLISDLERWPHPRTKAYCIAVVVSVYRWYITRFPLFSLLYARICNLLYTTAGKP